MRENQKLRAGDRVEIRSKEEILRTLDKNGRLEELPFMPQMFQYCGQRFRVFKCAHKTCDTVGDSGGRRMQNAVHLEGIRCDGKVYGGCEAGCLIFWKEAWLERVDNSEPEHGETASVAVRPAERRENVEFCSEEDVLAGTRRVGGDANSDGPTYVCQATQLPYATEPLRWWNLRQYVEDYASGNARLSEMLASFLFFLYSSLAEAGVGLGTPLRWAYDVFQKLRGGPPFPMRTGRISAGGRTPSRKLNLQPGELVRVRSYPEILETVDENYRNRGLGWHAELVPFCNGTYRVLRRVRHIVDEKTGKLKTLKNEAIILEDVFCRARYINRCRKFCPRSIYSYWREIWLERVSSDAQDLAKEKRERSDGEKFGLAGASPPGD